MNNSHQLCSAACDKCDKCVQGNLKKPQWVFPSWRYLIRGKLHCQIGYRSSAIHGIMIP